MACNPHDNKNTVLDESGCLAILTLAWQMLTALVTSGAGLGTDPLHVMEKEMKGTRTIVSVKGNSPYYIKQ